MTVWSFQIHSYGMLKFPWFVEDNQTTIFEIHILAKVRLCITDIHIQLYPDEWPNTVENFTTHWHNGHENDNLIFHRVINGLIIQNVDPLGERTVEQSIWGRDFMDEFQEREKVKTDNEDEPYQDVKLLNVNIAKFCIYS
ncbi:hypothetical protein C5167_049667 [Papaver somniferum]|uniref:peptidylprolyl isomerase n=1 Tax=Papaver somniferum TaxID=3469 RepID=A0A4Y7KPC0_PAPSO|nr:hypothetical protein C5167_049667 [Papaver somniferum]